MSLVLANYWCLVGDAWRPGTLISVSLCWSDCMCMYMSFLLFVFFSLELVLSFSPSCTLSHSSYFCSVEPGSRSKKPSYWIMAIIATNWTLQWKELIRWIKTLEFHEKGMIKLHVSLNVLYFVFLLIIWTTNDTINNFLYQWKILFYELLNKKK